MATFHREEQVPLHFFSVLDCVSTREISRYSVVTIVCLCSDSLNLHNSWTCPPLMWLGAPATVDAMDTHFRAIPLLYESNNPQPPAECVA